jgi:hypothetical protein
MQWWDRKYGKDAICPISRTRLRSGKNRWGKSYSIFLPCKHGFNRLALMNWTLSKPESNPTCPMCRKIFPVLYSFF